MIARQYEFAGRDTDCDYIAAIEGNSIRWAVYDFDEVLPPGGCGHDLLRSPAERKGWIVGVQCETHVRFFGDGNDGLEEIRNVGPHFVQRVRTLLWQWRKIIHPVIIDSSQPGAAPTDLFERALHRSRRLSYPLVSNLSKR